MNQENQNFCQSCGMPMGDTDELYGTQADGSKSADYCSYCYEDGKFSADVTMDQMIDFCAKPMADAIPGMTTVQAKEQMLEFFPLLKRWKNSEK